MRTAEEFRADFLLDPGIVHLNHGSFGATPQPVLRHQQELRDELERNPVEFLGRRLPEALAAARAEVARFAGVSDPGRLVLVANATTALNAVAASLPLAAGDSIVTTDREYGAMRLLWEEIAARAGAELVVARLPLPAVDDGEVVESVWRAVTPRTRVLFVSHVTSETALVLPVEELCRRAREAGILTVVDGAHAPGQLPLALDKLGADCYAGNGHKWLCGPKGSAFLYVREELHGSIRPAVVSWGWHEALDERFGWSGTDDPTAVLALPAAIAYQRENDWPAVRERCRRLARKTADAVLERLGGEPVSAPGLQAPQMTAFPVPHADPDDLQRELREQHGIEIPVRAVDGRPLVRLSVQAYNSDQDCERLVTALASVPRNAKSR